MTAGDDPGETGPMADAARPATLWSRDNPHEADKLLRCIAASSHSTRHKNLLTIHLSKNSVDGPKTTLRSATNPPVRAAVSLVRHHGSHRAP